MNRFFLLLVFIPLFALTSLHAPIFAMEEKTPEQEYRKIMEEIKKSSPGQPYPQELITRIEKLAKNAPDHIPGDICSPNVPQTHPANSSSTQNPSPETCKRAVDIWLSKQLTEKNSAALNEMVLVCKMFLSDRNDENTKKIIQIKQWEPLFYLNDDAIKEVIVSANNFHQTIINDQQQTKLALSTPLRPTTRSISRQQQMAKIYAWIEQQIMPDKIPVLQIMANGCMLLTRSPGPANTELPAWLKELRGLTQGELESIAHKANQRIEQLKRLK